MGVGIILLDADICRAGEDVFEAEKIFDEWQSAVGTVVLAEGEIAPRYMRGEQDSVNAVANAQDFVAETDKSGNPTRFGGIYIPDTAIVPPSNAAALPLILDGDRSGGWAPSEDDPLSTWWVMVDLGRAVRATKVRLVFAEDANPFEMFELYKSTGDEAFKKRSGVLDFRTVHRTTGPNSEHVLSFDLDETLVRLFYLQASVKTAGAELAEIEVLTIGDNVALGSQARGGKANTVVSKSDILTPRPTWQIVDGDYTTSFNLSSAIAGDWFRWETAGWFHLDMGNLFWVDLVRIVQVVGGGRLSRFNSYVLLASDNSTAPAGSGGSLGSKMSPLVGDLVWQEVGNLPINPPEGETEARYLFEEALPLQPVQHLFFSHRNRFGQSGLSQAVLLGEFQVFGRGYVPEVTLTSGFMDLGAARNLTGISWEGEAPVGSQIQIRSRTGEDFRWEVTYWQRRGSNLRNKELESREDWLALSTTRKGAVDSTALLKGWSEWSHPYVTPGESFVSPSPRRFVQLEAKLLTTDPDARTSLKSLSLLFQAPVATAISGQITPRFAEPGREDVFTYSIHSEIAVGQGFDDILILTPSPATLLDVRMADGSVLDLVEPILVDEDSLRPAGDNFLWIRLPPALSRTLADTPDPSIDLVFTAKVFANGTLVESFVGSSSTPGSWQRVDPVDARPENLTVSLALKGKVIGDVSVSSRVFTPNGDGVNDAATIEFSIYQIDEPRPVNVTIYGLGGRQVRRIGRLERGGTHQIVWNGLDDSDRIVPPGVYIYRVELDADAGSKVATGTVAVAY